MPVSPAPRLPRELHCPQCGAAFVCGTGGRDGGCWCADLPPLPRLDDDSDCLCPACLAARQQRPLSSDK
jgi:rubredoxin